MKCSLGILILLKRSLVFPILLFFCFFALITEEGFLIFPFYSLELCIQMGISFLSPLLLASLLFSAICKASSDNCFAFLHLSLRKSFLSLFTILWNSAFRWVYLSFLLCLSLLFFSQLFVRHPQTTILPFAIHICLIAIHNNQIKIKNTQRKRVE